MNVPPPFDGVIRAVLEAADPARALSRAWARGGNRAEEFKRCRVLAVGKASAAMADAAVDRCGLRPERAVLIKPPEMEAPRALDRAVWRVFDADHPLPTSRNVEAAGAAKELVEHAARDGAALVVLLSGGSSAQLTLPAEGVGLNDLRMVTGALLRAGAPIEDLNAVRRHCEVLKGGGLARLAAPAPVRTFILSDVLGDRLEDIGSGPTAPDPSTFADALKIIERRGAVDAGSSVMAYLRAGARGEREETLKPAEFNGMDVRNRVIANNAAATDAAAWASDKAGYGVRRYEDPVRGGARECGAAFARELCGLAVRGCRVAIIAGGETTVRVRGSGFGGRNQEAALAAALELRGRAGFSVMCFATDGADGTAPDGKQAHAGAVVTGETAERAEGAGLSIERALAANGSYGACERLDCAIRTGPTGTNVNDVWVGLAEV